MNGQRVPGQPVGGDPWETLRQVAETLEAVAAAVIDHDRDRLDCANEHARELLGTLAAQVGEIEEAGIPFPVDGRAALLAHGLHDAVRRNSVLIERAWAMDAATTRLLLSLGRAAADSPAGVYAPSPVLSIERSA